MATPPTYIGQAATSWNATTSPRSASSALTVVTNDIIVGLAADANNETGAQNFTFGPGTFTEQTLNEGGSGANTASGCPVQTGIIIPSAGSFTGTIAAAQTGTAFGAAFAQFRGSDGVGAQAQANSGTATSAPSVNITPQADNSALVMICADWNATDGVNRVYRTVNGITPVKGGAGEIAYFRNTTDYGVYVAYWSDAGAAGVAKTVGLTAPTQRWTIAVVEIKGAAAGGPAPFIGWGVPL